MSGDDARRARIAQSAAKHVALMRSAGPSVLDSRPEMLEDLAHRARHVAAAVDLAKEWMRPDETRDLGSLLKVVPPEVFEEITGHLRCAGLLAEERAP
ncbi:hypothetical protein [Streptomyces iconiensis]|uniref:Uncharacterized protein n=1 Tax=Streptomyces iconiensis TaxID=1384038 RepID=A0ABT6ZRU1_9ACTN|nr:hypothetical protein [Streptomyces iconiensis]MDJ1131770.1 hypothetical protein [Streptomyces iconiensis]